jgi:hypothetical protein
MVVRRDVPALMKVSTDEGVDGGDTLSKKPAAIPQQLELTRSLASVSNIYSHYVADIWLAFAIVAAHSEVLAVAREQLNAAVRLHAWRAIAVELDFVEARLYGPGQEVIRWRSISPLCCPLATTQKATVAQ